MDINALNSPIGLDRQLSSYINEYMKRPTDFSAANRSFGSMVANPMLFMGPGGQAADPNQQAAAAGQNYLGERRGAAQNNMAQQGQFANLLMKAGSNIGDLTNWITQLTAQNMGGSGGGIGGGMFGF